MIPMNLMKNGVACYVETGAWSKKAIAEAKKYGDVTRGGLQQRPQLLLHPQLR